MTSRKAFRFGRFASSALGLGDGSRRRLAGRSGSALAVALLVLLLGSPRLFAQDAATPAPPVESQPVAEPGPPPPSVPPELVKQLADMQAEITRAERSVEQNRDREERLSDERTALDKLETVAQAAADALGPRLKAVSSQIEKLGAAPAKDAPPEAPALTQERQRLGTQLADIDAAARKVEVIKVRLKQLIGRIQDLRHESFARHLSTRQPSLLGLTLWRDASRDLVTAGREIDSINRAVWPELVAHATELSLLAGIAVVIGVGLRFLCKRLIGRLLKPADAPTFLSRTFRAIGTVPLRSAPYLLALAALVFGLQQVLNSEGPGVQEVSELSYGLLEGLVVVIVSIAIAAAIFEPTRPDWRLFDLGDKPALRVTGLFALAAAVLGLGHALTTAIRLLYLRLTANILVTTLEDLVFGLAILGFVFVRLERRTSLPGAAPRSLAEPRALKIPALAAASAILSASLAGFAAFGQFMVWQTVAVGGLLIGAFILDQCVAGAAERLSEPNQGRLYGFASRLGLSRQHQTKLSVVFRLAAALVMLLVAAPIWALTIGFSSADIIGVARQAVFGFDVGSIRVAPARILTAILLFIGLIALTRLVQRWLATSLLSAARMDAGVANSIDTVIGYVGIALAALIGISYAGFDVTNLAIVAGALSVGIGFGLQSIVNNFVSGLILLIERPVKIGDWIVVKGQEGYVKRISVRATEIETFDRASLIVPNSELISAPVTNWTHRNAMGRLTIKVSASYKADPGDVLAILNDVAQKSPYVLKLPAPRAVFEEFGANGQEFTLRVHLADINAFLEAQTELRLAIARSFRAARIEIPYPQTDVHLRDLDQVRQLIYQAMEARRREAEAARAATEAEPKPPGQSELELK